MKKFIIGVVLIFISIAAAQSASFCSGWRAGYVAGYCYGDAYCLEPLVPLCPLPYMGEDSWQGGYNRGFLTGLNRR